jgi:hypothetical protein
MRKISEFNAGTASRGDAYYSIMPSTGSLTNTTKFEGAGEDTKKFGEKQ